MWQLQTCHSGLVRACCDLQEVFAIGSQVENASFRAPCVERQSQLQQWGGSMRNTLMHVVNTAEKEERRWKEEEKLLFFAPCFLDLFDCLIKHVSQNFGGLSLRGNSGLINNQRGNSSNPTATDSVAVSLGKTQDPHYLVQMWRMLVGG